MSFTTAPLNAQQRMVDHKGRPAQSFIDWITPVTNGVDAAPSGFAPVVVTGKNAAIGTTAIPTEVLDAGLYRVTWYARITTAATTGAQTSSLTVTVAWTDLTVSQSFSGAAITGNAVTTNQSETKLLYVDAATPISYSTAYASDTASQMQYRLSVYLERVSA